MQTLSLAATDLGLAACPIGAIDASSSASFLTPCQDRLIHVGSLALGLPRTDEAPTPVLRLQDLHH